MLEMLEIKNAVVVVSLFFFESIIACVVDWQIQITFAQRNQYHPRNAVYAKRRFRSRLSARS